MASPLSGSLAVTIGSAMAFLFLDATLKRNVAVAGSGDPFDPAPRTTTSYTCKAIHEKYGVGLIGAGVVDGQDRLIMILATSFKLAGVAVAGFKPAPGDTISFGDGQSFTIVPAGSSGLDAVTTDPAKAVWNCRCRG